MHRNATRGADAVRAPYAHHPLGNVFDDLDWLVHAVALLAGEVDEFLRSLDDSAAFRCARDRDAAPAAELQ